MSNRLEQPLTSRFSEALLYAADIHRHQARKGSQIPYIAHILGVVSVALEYGANEDEAIAAILHDAIEDAPGELGPDEGEFVRRWIRYTFGAAVVAIVEACTDADVKPKPPWRERKEAYLASIAHKSASALMVSASDKVHNARAILNDFREVSEAVFDRFNRDAGKEGTLWYYRAVTDAISHRAASLRDERVRRLAGELDRVVSTLEREVLNARG